MVKVFMQENVGLKLAFAIRKVISVGAEYTQAPVEIIGPAFVSLIEQRRHSNLQQRIGF
jgi:hypothetical protein